MIGGTVRTAGRRLLGSYRARPRRTRVAVAVLVAGALVASGLVAGWFARGWAGDDPGPRVSVSVNRPVTPLARTTRSAMPSVIGLGASEARRALFDAGVEQSAVATTAVPAAGPAGTVVTQSPVAGTRTVGSVSLGLSTPARMPRLIGEDGETARATLAGLGSRVRITQAYSPGARQGSVLAVTPAVGALLPLDSSVVLAAPPSSVYLDEIDALSSDCSGTTSVALSGTTYAHGVACTPGQDSPTELEYVLNRKVTQFAAVLGQDDAGRTGLRAAVIVYRDGRAVTQTAVTFGRRVPIAVNTLGALRLRVVVRWIGAPKECCSDGPTVVLANARLVGSQTAIDTLAGTR